MTERFRLLLHCTLLKTTLLLLFALLHGCAGLPVTGKMPPGLEIVKSLPASPDAPFAWHPQGERVAVVVKGALQLWDPRVGELKLISPASPAALAWSPDGSRLAAGFSKDKQTELAIFNAEGEREDAASLPGRVVDLFWTPELGLFALSTSIKLYSFGGHFQLALHRWSPGQAPQTTILHEATLKPLTLKQWQNLLYYTPNPALSFLGDELLYARIHDPPAFSPYLKIILRHMGTGVERQVASVPVTSGAAVFANSGETVLYGEGTNTHTVDPWTGRKGEVYPAPGRNIAVSPGGSYLYLDGDLYRDGGILTSFPANAAVAFLPKGGKMLLRHESRLFLLDGLKEPAPAPLPNPGLHHLLKLRQWRSTGLISPDEYLKQKQRIFE